jgi:glycopeptide antibiotics resistance protein
MDIQEIIAFMALGIALAFLIKKFFLKKKKSAKNCGDDDCGCH